MFQVFILSVYIFIMSRAIGRNNVAITSGSIACFNLSRKKEFTC